MSLSSETRKLCSSAPTIKIPDNQFQETAPHLSQCVKGLLRNCSNNNNSLCQGKIDLHSFESFSYRRTWLNRLPITEVQRYSKDEKLSYKELYYP